MDRLLGFFVIVALLFPNGNPLAGKVCHESGPSQPSCCSGLSPISGEMDLPPLAVERSCCCDVRLPEPVPTPEPTIQTNGDQKFSLCFVASFCQGIPLAPQRLNQWTIEAPEARGPPGEIFRRYCVIRC